MTGKSTLAAMRMGGLIGLLVVVLVVLVRSAGGFQFLEFINFDLFTMARSPQVTAGSRLALVSVDEEDIARLGEWPLSDLTISRIIERLEASNPRAIGLDIYRDRPVEPGAQLLQDALLNNKRIIVVKKFPSGDSPGVRPPQVMDGSGRVGFTDTVIDPDGVVRRGLLYLDDDTGVSFGLGLQLALLYLADEGIVPRPGVPDPASMRLGAVTLPPFEGNEGPYVSADAAGYQLLLDYREGVTPFASVSLSQLLDGDVPSGMFRDKIVIVGVAAESVKDAFATPFSRGAGQGATVPGIVIHAYLASQLLRAGLEGDGPLRSPAEPLEVLWIILWGALACVAAFRVRSFPRLLVLTLAGVAAIAALGYLAFVNDWWIAVAPAVASWLLAAGLVTAWLSGFERQQRGLLMQLFARHVSKDVAEEIWRNREAYFEHGRLRSRQQTVTVMFTDIVHFTTVSEQLDPEALFNWLNEYMELMANTVIKYNGVIDDYYGDAIKANFGAPILRTTNDEVRQDAGNAVRCAPQMGRQLEKYNSIGKARDLPHLRMRIGLCTGSVIAGCLGSAQRMKYTTIGDTVNTAARIENHDKESFDIPTEQSDCRILLAESTLRIIGDGIPAVAYGSVKLRGKKKPVKVYRVDGGAVPARMATASREVRI